MAEAEERLRKFVEQLAEGRHYDASVPLAELDMYHQGQLKSWARCGRALQLAHEAGYPQPKKQVVYEGKFLHKFAERWEKEGRVLMPVGVRQVFGVAWVDEDASPGLDSVRDDLLAVAQEYAKWTASQGLCVASEMPFVVQVADGLWLAGVVDQWRLAAEPGFFAIFDLKWSQSWPDDVALARDLQFSIYYLAAAEGLFWLNGEPTPHKAHVKLAWIHLKALLPYKKKTKRAGVAFEKGDLRGDPYVPVYRDAEDIPRIKSEIRGLVAAIRAGAPKTGGRGGHACPCPLCDVQHLCLPYGQRASREATATLAGALGG